MESVTFSDYRGTVGRIASPAFALRWLTPGRSVTLIESGATTLQGRAVTGHKSDRMFNHYAKTRDRELDAATAMANRVEEFAKSTKK